MYSSSSSSTVSLVFSERQFANGPVHFMLGRRVVTGGGGESRGGTSYSSVARWPLEKTLAPSEGKSWRLCFLIRTCSEPILLCLPFKLEFAVTPGFGEPSPRMQHPITWLVPKASRGHQASRGMGWSREGTLSPWWKCLLSLLSGGMGGGLSGGGGGSLKGGGGAGSGLSCFLTMHGEDFGEPVGLPHGERTMPF